VFDEARALEEIKSQLERRDEAKGEFKDAILLIGQKLIEARRALPGASIGNGESYSPAFLAFIEKSGVKKVTASMYMSYARDPRRLDAERARQRAITAKMGGAMQRASTTHRRRTLADVQALLAEAPDLETARRIITEELNELIAAAPPRRERK
jgi:hypothetical protein